VRDFLFISTRLRGLEYWDRGFECHWQNDYNYSASALKPLYRLCASLRTPLWWKSGYYCRKHLRKFISTSSINLVDKSRISAANYPKLGSSTRAAFTSVINFLGWWDNYERIFDVFGNLSTTFWHDSLSLHQCQRRLSVGCLLFWNKHASPIKTNHTTKCVRQFTNVVTAHQLFPCITPDRLVRHLLPCTATASAISYRRGNAWKYRRSYNLRILVYRTCLAKFLYIFTTTTTAPNVKVPPMSYVMQLY